MLAATLSAGPGRAEGFKLSPSLTASGIYDDNFFNDPDRRRTEYIARFMPALDGSYEGPRISLDLSYTLDYRFYLKGERSDEDVHFLDAGGVAALYRQILFLEIRNELSRVSLDAARDFREESLFLNQSDRNVFSVSPYFELAPSLRDRIRGGYRFVDIRYSGIGVDRQNHIAFVEGTRELTARTTARIGYQFLTEHSDLFDHDKHDLYAGLRSQISENLSVFGTLGHTWIDFETGSEVSDIFWELGASREFRWVTATAALGRRYIEDPRGTIFREEHYRLTLSKDWSRSRAEATFGFSEFYDSDVELIDTRRYGGSLTLHHEFLPRWLGTAYLSGHLFDDPVEDTETRRMIYHLALSYLLADDFTATLGFYRIDSHSPEIRRERFDTNRVVLEARKVF